MAWLSLIPFDVAHFDGAFVSFVFFMSFMMERYWCRSRGDVQEKMHWHHGRCRNPLSVYRLHSKIIFSPASNWWRYPVRAGWVLMTFRPGSYANRFRNPGLPLRTIRSQQPHSLVLACAEADEGATVKAQAWLARHANSQVDNVSVANSGMWVLSFYR